MAAISFKTINRAALAERRVHKKLTMITIILYAVAAVLFIFTSDSYGISSLDGPNNGLEYFQPSLWGVFFAVLGVIVGYITALNMFRDMNNQQICDVTMALPIKSEERFLSKLTAIAYIQIIPQLIAVFGGCGISILIGTIACRGVEAEVVQKFFAVVLMFLAASMFTIAVAVLCVCCCGSFAESIYFSLILMVIINALPIGLAFRIFDQCSGIDWISSHQSIFSYWGFLFVLHDDYYGYLGLILSSAVGILISAAVCFAMLFVYRKRDARSVGNPISSRVFFELIMFLGVITVYTAFVMSYAAFWGLLIAAVIYVIINIIVSRAKINVFSFLKWGAKFAAATLIFAAVLIPAIKTGGFGFINTRPSDAELDGSRISVAYSDVAEEIDEDGISYQVYTVKELKADALTEKQAAQIMDIYKKYLVRGRAELNPITVITENTDYEKYSNVSITVNGKELDEKPQGTFIGYEYWESYRDYGFNEDQSSRVLKTKYNLHFDQNLIIPLETAREMVKELKSLNLMYEPSYY